MEKRHDNHTEGETGSYMLFEALKKLDRSETVDKKVIVAEIVAAIETAGYVIFELNDTKPWGAYFRIEGKQADIFVQEFFLGLSPEDARLGMEDAELSPKILLVAPQQRLSWQYHNRRAERWAFQTDGSYHKSETDDQGEQSFVQPGSVVQFAQGERHRLVGLPGSYTIVAEIWQHTNRLQPSDEEDIVRLQDDFSR